MALTDRFNLTGELRWYDFEEARSQRFDGLFADPLDSEGATSANGVAPRIIASYDVTAATQVNAQVSKGFRLGGINDPLNTPICSPEDLATFGGRGTWEDEQLWNYEAGVKSTFLGGRGTFNAAGFYMDVSNLQATVTAGTCSSRIIFNLPDARSAGIELELAAQPTTFFDFAVSASVADARLQSDHHLDRRGRCGQRGVGHRGGQATADHAPLPDRGRGHLALARRRRLGRLPQRHLSARRLPLHVGRRPGRRLRRRQSHSPVAGPAPRHVHRRAAGPEHLRVQSGVARLQHPQRAGRLSQRPLGHRLLRRQPDRRARVPGPRPGAGYPGPGVGYLTNPPRSFGISTRIDF